MAIKRYTASSDTTITDAFKENLTTRGSGSNMGEADVLEMFSIWGQVSSSATGPSLEKSRMLLQFPITDITTDRAAGTIPPKDSVNFYLKIHNAEHHRTVPSDFNAAILAVSESWSEGRGLDLDEYRDVDYANWDMRTSGSSGITAWGNAGTTYHAASHKPGGVYHTGSVESWSSNVQYSASFGEHGTEDIEVDITSLVEHWIAGTIANNGVGVMLSGTFEDGSSKRSYYTKKFFSRTSEFFFKRPTIEARWDSTIKDDRQNFYASSPLVGTAENTNTVYLYNYARGQLTNIPSLHASNTVAVKFYRDALTDDTPQVVVGGLTDDSGIYSASIVIDTSASVLYDVWSTGSGGSEKIFYTGSISVKTLTGMAENPTQLYTTSMPNLKPKYSTKETARFRFFTRKQNWSPTIYTKATEVSNADIVESAFYKIFRVSDGLEVIPYGTGSTNHTKMSYDQSGSYFDLDMKMLQADYSYGLSVAYYLNGKYVEQPEVFKFRVEE